MLRTILRRIIFTIITLIGVSIIAFALVRLAGGDPARQMLPSTATEEQVQLQHEKMGLDKPLVEQYLTYMKGVFKGDLGYSYNFNMKNAPLIWSRFKQTAILTGATILISLLFAMVLGLLAGTHKGSIIDTVAMFFALVGQAIPQVWLCLLLILVFGVKLHWLPVQGYGDIKHMILPAICGGVGFASGITRMLRSGMIDTLSEDYITATRARGISKFKVDTVYACKNALLPIVTMLGSNIGGMLAGSMIIEVIFGWPGLGQLVVVAIGVRDYQLVQSCLLVSAAIMVFCVLCVDILYTVIDKRIKFN